MRSPNERSLLSIRSLVLNYAPFFNPLFHTMSIRNTASELYKLISFILAPIKILQRLLLKYKASSQKHKASESSAHAQSLLMNKASVLTKLIFTNNPLASSQPTTSTYASSCFPRLLHTYKSCCLSSFFRVAKLPYHPLQTTTTLLISLFIRGFSFS